jgi:hypothetical protein
MKTKIKDYPKIESPFIRKILPNGDYILTSEINPEGKWVFEGKEDEVAAVEKIDGTNCSVVIENGLIVSIWNRTERLPFFNKGKAHIIEGVYEAYLRGWLDLPDGQHFGELIGPKLNGNPLKLEKHLFVPFSWLIEHCSYNSWHKYPKSFDNICKWFFTPIKDGGIFSLFMRRSKIEQKPEGIVFHNLKTGQLAKLRLDMFKEWNGSRHNDGIPRKEKNER